MFTIQTSIRNRFLIIISLTLAYIAIYMLLHPSIGAAVNVLVIVPAAMTAWLFGVRSGITASLCAIGLTTLLATLSHDPSLTEPSWQATRLLGYVVICLVTITFGFVHRLSERLQSELLRREEAERMQNQRNAELEAVHRASLQLASSLELKPLLETILVQITTLLHAYNVHIFLYDGEKLTFGAALVRGQHQDQPVHEPRPHGITYTVARSGRRLLAPNMEQSPLFQETGWVGSMSGFPLSIRDRVYGVMNIAFDRPHDFGEGELRIIELLADQAAVAIRNAHDYEQTRHHAEELEQAVAARTAELLRAKESAEALLNNSFDVILLLSADGTIKQTNPAFERVFGKTQSESFSSFVSLFGDGALIEATLKSAAADHTIKQLEATALRSGGEFTADLVFVPLESAGAVVEILCNLRDVTDRKRAEVRQRALSHGLRKVLALTYELISCADMDELWKRAVEMAREVLNVERCSIFIERDNYMYGTYGTSLQRETTDEHQNNYFKGQRSWARLETVFALDTPAWEVEYQPLQEWDGEATHDLQLGWSAVTPIHSAYRFIGIFYNDTAISHAPLDEIQQEIISMYCSFLGSLYEHKRVEEEIHRALGHEKELSELKSRFTSMISHELRTPLTSIQLSTDFLKRYPDRLTEAMTLGHIGKIQDQVRHLTNLLEDVLVFTKAEQVGLQAQLRAVDLNAFCSEVAAEMRTTHPSHSVSFAECPGDWTASIDTKLTRQALMNLMINAVKYSPEGSTITLALAREGKDAIIRVSDQGIGIPETDLPRIFEVFYRARNVDTVPGTGLGLAIVRQIAEAHHGFVFCESSAEAGTTFTLQLPVFA